MELFFWSNDQNRGGGRICKGKVPAEKIAIIVEKIRNDGFFSEARLRQEYASPESTVMSIRIRNGGKVFTMKSLHELAELDGKEVAVNDAIIGLDGETRLGVLSNEPADYLFYRLAWEELRGMTFSLIPRDQDAEVVREGIAIDKLIGR